MGAAADDVEVEAAVDRGGGDTVVVPLALLVGYAVGESEIPVPVER